MASLTPAFTGEEAQKAMLDGLISRIRSELRERIIASIEPDIAAAIDAAIDGFKVGIESYREAHNMRDTIRILVDRKDAA